MGILSRVAKRKKKEVVEEAEKTPKKRGRPKVKRDINVDLAMSLAMYIVSFEIVMAEVLEANDTLVGVYEKFRSDWKLEDMLKDLGGFDKIMKTVYPEVERWLGNV